MSRAISRSRLADVPAGSANRLGAPMIVGRDERVALKPVPYASAPSPGLTRQAVCFPTRGITRLMPAAGCAARRTLGLAVALSLLVLGSVGAVGQDQGTLNRQQAQYDASVPKTILELQPFRQTSSIRIAASDGREGFATLVNLHPAINAWYLLTVKWKDERSDQAYHLENPKPRDRTLQLDAGYPSGLVVEESGHRSVCPLFGTETSNVLEQASASR